MEFKILGPLDVIEGERVVDLAGAKQRALLAMLLLHANGSFQRRLIDALWEERPPDTGVKALQVHVSQLRKRSAGTTRDKGPGYLLRVGAGRARPRTLSSACQDAGGVRRKPFAVARPAAGRVADGVRAGEIGRLEELRLGSR